MDMNISMNGSLLYFLNRKVYKRCTLFTTKNVGGSMRAD